jgi:hypothetical protein
MIKGKELRLGNLVKDRGDKVIRIDFLEHIQDGYDTKFGQLIFLEGTEIHPITEYADYANAIPITDDWIIRFGFERQDNNWKRLCICNDWTYLYWEKLDGFALSVNKHSVMLPHIKYAHQLQNFIYYLTGEELKCAL